MPDAGRSSSRDASGRASAGRPDAPGSPRIAPLPSSEWDDLLRTLLANSPGGLERPLNIFTTLARHPDLFRQWLGFGGALLAGRLAARQRELVILRTAHRCGSDYEWVQHLRLAALAAVREDEIEATRSPLDSWRWADEDRVVLEAADELLEEGSIADSTWEALSRRLDDASLIELVMLVGHYQLLAMTIRTLRIQLEEG